MLTYPLTKDVAYTMKDPSTFSSQNANAFMRSCTFIYDEIPYDAPTLLRVLSKSSRNDLSDAVLALSVQKTLLLGMMPFRVMIDPLLALQDAARAGMMILGDNIPAACFSRSIELAQGLALSFAPKRMQDICNLFHDPFVADQLGMKMSQGEVKREYLLCVVARSEFPLMLPSSYAPTLDNLLESNANLSNVHACCFSDARLAISKGAHFDADAYAMLGGTVATTEAQALSAGYDWRMLTVLPLLPEDEKGQFLMDMVVNAHTVKRGLHHLKHALSVEPDAFEASLSELGPVGYRRLIAAGALSQKNIGIMSEVGQSLLLEVDLGL